MPKARTQIEGETLTHRVLWACCREQMAAAQTVERGGFYFHLAAMLMAYLTYESYLNFLGDRVAPDEWAMERERFRREPYKGIEGKLRKICEAIGTEVPDSGSVLVR